MALHQVQVDALKRRLPTFDPDACAFLFASEQPDQVGAHLGIVLANGATWYPDPWDRPTDEKGRPRKVKAAPRTPRRLLVGPGSDNHELILVEGEGHAAALASNGVGNVVVAGGTKNLLSDAPESVEKRRLLLQGKHVRLWFDADSEGREGAARVARHLLEERAVTGVVSVSIVKPPRGWPSGSDVLDFVARFTPSEPLNVRQGRLVQPLSNVIGPFTRASDVRDPEESAPGGESVQHDGPLRVRILSRKELEEAVSPDQIADRFVYKGSTHMLNGASKAGKSMLATQLGMCVATGTPFLGLSTSQSRVLLISLEMSAGLVWQRMERIAKDTSIPTPDQRWFKVVAPIPGETPQVDLTKESGVADLRRLIREAEAELVILDTLYRFVPGVEPNDNGLGGKIMGSLNTIANDTGAAILVINHSKKRQGDEDSGPVSHSGIGAQIYGGAANVIAALQRTSKQDGGSWKLEVEGHYDCFEEPIYYKRPRRADESIGAGCVVSTASEARGVTADRIAPFFEQKGSRVGEGVYAFHSRNALEQALMQAGVVKSDGAAGACVEGLLTDFGGAALVVLSGVGPRRANFYVWRGDERVQPVAVRGAIQLLSGEEYAHTRTARAAADAAMQQDPGI